MMPIKHWTITRGGVFWGTAPVADDALKALHRAIEECPSPCYRITVDDERKVMDATIIHEVEVLHGEGGFDIRCRKCGKIIGGGY